MNWEAAYFLVFSGTIIMNLLVEGEEGVMIQMTSIDSA